MIVLNFFLFVQKFFKKLILKVEAHTRKKERHGVFMNEELIFNLINDCNGVDGEGESKSIVSLSIERWDVQNEKITPLNNYTSMKASVEMFSVKEKYMMVDLHFLNSKITDLRMLWKLAEKRIDDIPENGKIITVKRLTITPKNFKGYYMDLVVPIFWTLQPMEINGEINTIRFLFDLEDVNFYYSDEIDVDKIKLQIDMDVAQKENETEDTLQNDNDTIKIFK